MERLWHTPPPLKFGTVTVDYVVEGPGANHRIVGVGGSHVDGGDGRVLGLGLVVEVLVVLIHVSVQLTSLGALMGVTALQLLLGELGAEEIVHVGHIDFEGWVLRGPRLV